MRDIRRADAKFGKFAWRILVKLGSDCLTMPPDNKSVVYGCHEQSHVIGQAEMRIGEIGGKERHGVLLFTSVVMFAVAKNRTWLGLSAERAGTYGPGRLQQIRNLTGRHRPNQLKQLVAFDANVLEIFLVQVLESRH
jgi:hypothetical protein